MKLFRCHWWVLFCLLSLPGFAQENCTNGKDDDGDGLIDLKDPDCQCHLTVTANLFQNGSFESFDHCPSYFYDNDFNIISHWQFGTFINGNEAIYYHNRSCAADSSLVMTYIPPSLPLPEGKAFVSIRQAVNRRPGYQETDIAKTYISQCLQQPLKAGEPYVFSFSAGRFQSNDDPSFKFRNEPFSVAIFGQADCNAVPFGKRTVNSNGCPLHYPGWVQLGAATVHSKGNWVQGVIRFTAPPGIRVVAIGPDCSLLTPETELPDSTTRSDFYVYYLDDVHLVTAGDFPATLIGTASGDPCASSPVLTAPTLPNAAYQWYKDSVAIAGATASTYRVASDTEAFYNVRVANADTCLVSEAFPAGGNLLSQLRLPADTVICRGERLLIDPALPGISYRWNGGNGPVVSIAEAGLYQIRAVANNGCSKTFELALQIQECGNGLLMPDAFTPNSDGRNDLFRIPPNSALELDEFLVYNRWGHIVFRTKNQALGWNGTEGSKRCPAGTYVYLVKGKLRSRAILAKGSLTLVR